MKVKLYIEGGGDSRLQDTQFRQAWKSFFEKAGLTGRMPATFRGGGREDTFDDFKIAVRTRKTDELPLLLVDSEETVMEGQSAWEHLKTRKADNWDKPEGTGDEHAFLMICCMETWLVADRSALKNFFGQCWRDNALPKWPKLEEISKTQVFDALDKATAACEKRRYAKGGLSFELLGRIDPAEVEKACPAAKRLLDSLRKL